MVGLIGFLLTCAVEPEASKTSYARNTSSGHFVGRSAAKAYIPVPSTTGEVNNSDFRAYTYFMDVL